MPRHFLVKRHKHCSAALSYRDRLHEGQDGVSIAGNASFVATSTTIIDTDKHIIIRDGDHFSDYSGYSSPDSGYAASPNSAHAGFAREKENVGTDRENNNNKNFNKVAGVVGFYDNGHTNVNSLHHNSSSSSSISVSHHTDSSSSDSRFMMVDPPDAPIDLSMPSRKKNVLSSVPAYLQQENHRHHHHLQIHHHSKNQQQQQQQQQHYYHRPPSPDPSTTSSSAAAAAVVYFNSFNNFYLNGKTDRSLCAVMPPLSPSHPAYNSPLPLHFSRPETRPSAHYPNSMKTDVLLETSAAAAHTEILSRAQRITVPTASSGQRLSSSSISSLSPQPPTPMTVRELVTTSHSDRLTPLKTPSPLQSPNRKRVISEDQGELSNQSCYPYDLSKSAPVLKKSETAHNTVTPASKGTTSSTQQRAKTTAPAVKKSQSATPSGKKLKAVRRLNFDIDTTSPVSGTIIKDAADFHPEEGKVVYGDIEPSFNFVEVTPEARAELEKIENKIGDYICQLCKEFYEDAFQLAQHRCSRIVHVEYRCPECEKVFNCPANLASHRRWHKPRASGQSKGNGQGAGKPVPVNQKIAPKPDCNGNNVTETLSATAVRTTSPSLAATSLDSGKSSAVNNDTVSKDVSSTNNTHVTEASRPSSEQSLEACTSGNFAISAEAGLPSYSFHDSSNFNSQSRGNNNSAVIFNALRRSSPKPTSEDERTSKSSEEEPSSKLTYLSQQQRQDDAHFRPSTVIATNPMHTTTTFGSTLTPEEKSLVLQVLNSHHRQHQTTTITSTTTVMTPVVSDSHCNIMAPENSLYVNGQRFREDDHEHSVRHDDSDCMETSSSPPLDLTHASDQYKQRDLLLRQQQQQKQIQQHQQQERQTGALSERQGNPQIECSLCGKKFQRQAYLRKHMHSQHNKQNAVIKPVDVSSNGEAKATDLSVQNNVTPSVNADPYVTTTNTATTSCGVCSKGFSSESARLKHEAVIHGLTPHLTCSTCGLSFTSKAAMDKHARSTHAAETYSCKYCSSTFHSSPGLTRHINKCHPTENRQVILLQLPASRTC